VRAQENRLAERELSLRRRVGYLLSLLCVRL
jgi:hypothetical protein